MVSSGTVNILSDVPPEQAFARAQRKRTLLLVLSIVIAVSLGLTVVFSLMR